MERGAAGRDKSCGHCLSARALPLLERLGLRSIIDAATVGETSSLRIEVGRTGRRGRVATPTPHAFAMQLARANELGGRLVERRILDALLVEAAVEAGAEVWRSTAATIIEGPPWRIELRAMAAERREPIVLAAPLLIGADGLGSGIARRMGWAQRQTGRAGGAFGFSTELPPTAMRRLRHGEVAMHLLSTGYLGAVRRRDGSVHLAGLVRAGDAPRAPREFVSTMAAAFPESFGAELEGIAPRHARWLAAGPMPWRPRRIAAPGVALIGDAAGYVEPFTGEGITWAFESAAALREVLPHAPGVFGSAEATDYVRLWRRSVGSAQRRCRLVAALLRRPGLLAGAAAIAPSLAQRITDAAQSAGSRTRVAEVQA